MRPKRTSPTARIASDAGTGPDLGPGLARVEASGVDVVDAPGFGALAAVARAVGWLGARSMLVGLTPGLVRYLIDAEVDTSAFAPYGTLDDALAALAAEAAPSVTADAERNDGPSVPASEPEA